MPKVTHNKTHKKRLNKFKANQKRMTEQKTQQGAPQFPPYRNVPTWDKNAKIEMFGYEWEVIYNTVAQLQALVQATNAVMSRNIVNGIIDMDFEKLDPKTLEYVEMSDEEKKPLREDFNNLINSLKAQADAQAAAIQPEQKVKVDETLSTDNSEAPKEAKVVRLKKAPKKAKEVVEEQV